LGWLLTAGACGLAVQATLEAEGQRSAAAAATQQHAERDATLRLAVDAAGAEVAALQAEVTRLEVASAAAAEEGRHLRIDRGAGQIELVEAGGFVIRRAPIDAEGLSAGLVALGGVDPLTLDGGAALSLEDTDRAAMAPALSPEMPVYVY